MSNITITDERLKHMRSVAEFMYKKAGNYDLDRDRMYILGYLHDIGFLYGPDGHSMHGARMVSKITGSFGDFSNIIAAHEMSPSEYIEKTGQNTMPRELLLLWEADMSVSYDGRPVTYEQKLEEIKNTEGEGDKYRNAKQIIDYLKGSGRKGYGDIEDMDDI